MVEEILDEVRKNQTNTSEFNRLFGEQVLRSSGGNGKLPDKEFVARNSLLTDLVEIKHIKAIYNLHIVGVIIMFLNCFIHDFVDSGKINLGLRPFIQGFRGFQFGAMVWLAMQGMTLCAFPGFMCWAKFRQLVPGFLKKLYDYISSMGFFIYIMWFGYFFTKTIKTLDVAPATTIAILLEMTRFMMKTYAFVRTCAPRAYITQKKEDKTLAQLPPLKSFLYFMVCPTLVYRDTYPRNKSIRWKFVFKCFMEVAGVMLYMSLMFERYVLPVFKEVGATKINSNEFVLQIFGYMMPALTIFCSGFYLLLHAWQNSFAEMLRFADRQFYQDWWSCTSFPEYYRKWNAVIHDWLYTYVYKDMYEIVFKGNRVAAMLMVFTISSFVHEYIIAFTFGFFYPIMLVLFEGCGVIVMFFTNKRRRSIGNIFMWFSITVGNALMLALYNMEYHARKNCAVGDSISDYFVPVSWSCNGIASNPDWKVQF